MKSERGFSLIELIIAMAIFGFMLMIVSLAFINIVRIHQAGIATRAVQQNSRLIMDEMVATARQSHRAVIMAAPSRACFLTANGTIVYELDSFTGDLYTGSSDPTCPSAVSFPIKINDQTVEYTKFLVTSTPAIGSALGTVSITLIAASLNNTSSLNGTKDGCLPGPGLQFCTVLTVISTASMRGGN